MGRHFHLHPHRIFNNLAFLKRMFSYSIAVYFSTLIISCTHLSPVNQPIEPIKKVSKEERTVRLASLNNWQLNGKIAVQTAHDAGSATLNWKQANNRYMIALYGPLGTNSLRLNGGPSGVTLINEQGQQLRAKTPEELLAKHWGYQVPVSFLKYWIKGLEVPGIPSQAQYDHYNRLVRLFQAGWQIQFINYHQQGPIDLPERLIINSPTLRTKLIIYHWQLS